MKRKSSRDTSKIGRISQTPWSLYVIVALLSSALLYLLWDTRQKLHALQSREEERLLSGKRLQWSGEAVSEGDGQDVIRRGGAQSKLRPATARAKSTAEKQGSGPDDLTRLKGIGPRVGDLLESAGISDYEALASASLDQLEEILREAGLQMIDPSNWSYQAQLARAGNWEAILRLPSPVQSNRKKKQAI